MTTVTFSFFFFFGTNLIGCNVVGLLCFSFGALGRSPAFTNFQFRDRPFWLDVLTWWQLPTQLNVNLGNWLGDILYYVIISCCNMYCCYVLGIQHFTPHYVLCTSHLDTSRGQGTHTLYNEDTKYGRILRSWTWEEEDTKFSQVMPLPLYLVVSNVNEYPGNQQVHWLGLLSSTLF